MPSAKSSSGAVLIKGYLPIRLTIPSPDGTELDDTFFYVKEHHGATASDEKKKRTPSTTLFVANAPFLPGISTKVLLSSLFGRYADVARVTVVQNPRSAGGGESTTSTSTTAWIDQTSKYPSFYYGTIESEGKFAHVVFKSNKDMKKALRCVRDAMSQDGKKHKGAADLPGIQLSRLHIQTLVHESMKVQGLVKGEIDHGDDDDDDENLENEEIDSARQTLTGILAVADRYRSSYRDLSRSALLEECNDVMESFEDAEEADRLAREAASAEPDDDGFVTVTYASQNVGSKREMEQHVGGGNKRKAHKRSRKKKDVTGKSELQDFYRFQMKESRKRNVQDLRKRFEEDLAKVKKMKEDRQYRPF
mmetsp:Transcript_9479/g.14573  ORF Transcript_9479/g.14573 Transcript_9479/m.14573 type:complete len:363 (+) Transcript_9479:94-1182(+)